MPTSSTTTIQGSPALADETLLSLNEACAEFPVRISRTCIERMIRKGARGVKLETILIGHRRFTSREAIQRFIDLSQGGNPKSTSFEPARKSNLAEKEIEARRKKYNMPKSGFTPM